MLGSNRSGHLLPGVEPETDEGRADAFAASACRVMFVGHFHRWLAATPAARLIWDGGSPIVLDARKRYLVVVAAVCDGWCAVFDAESGQLSPYRLTGSVASSQVTTSGMLETRPNTLSPDGLGPGSTGSDSR